MIKPCEYCGQLYQSQPNGNSRHCSAKCRTLSATPSIGSTFDRWTVMENHERGARGRLVCTVRCICGVVRKVAADALRNGTSRSCGCLKSEVVHGKITHGMSYTPEWKTYHSAKKRCNNPNDSRFESYGGRGIKFLFTSFEEFYKEIGPKPSAKHSINRIDNDGPYGPGNVEWATDVQQRQNKRRNGPIPGRKNKPP